MLEAKILATSTNSLNNHFNSSWFPLLVSLNNVSQTLDSLADFRAWVKKLIKSFLELAELASI